MDGEPSSSDSEQDAAVTFDKHFCCPICYDLLETPLTRSCGHTFCAGCLRAAKRNRVCAVCRTKDAATPRKLCENIALREAIEATYPEVARRRNARRERGYRLDRLRQRYLPSGRYRFLAHFVRTVMTERRIVELDTFLELLPTDELWAEPVSRDELWFVVERNRLLRVVFGRWVRFKARSHYGSLAEFAAWIASEEALKRDAALLALDIYAPRGGVADEVLAQLCGVGRSSPLQAPSAARHLAWLERVSP